MHRFIRVALLLSAIALLMVVTTTPVLANGNGTCVVAPTIKADEVKEPVAVGPDKSAHPVHGTNPAYGGFYDSPGAPGKVFWMVGGGD